MNTQVLNMFWMTDGFSLGLTIGLLMGLSLHMILKYIYKNKPNKPEKNNTQLNGFTIEGNFKMVLLVRSDLRMGKGKVAAQVRYILESK